MNQASIGSLKSWAAVLLLLATLAVYWPVRNHGFINFDDPDYVSSNARVQAGLTPDSIHWAFTQSHSSNWHPLTWLSHMLDCQLFGLKPGAHHLVNVVLHLLNTLLLMWLLARMTGAWWRSWIVAALFALHPLHVESVAWISERKDVLSTFFGLLTLLAYVRYARQTPPSPPRSNPSPAGAGEGGRRPGEGRGETSKQSGRGKGEVSTLTSSSQPGTRNPELGTNIYFSSPWYWLALVFFALGLMSKPMLVTWPFVLLLLDFWPLRRLQLSTFNSQPSTRGRAKGEVSNISEQTPPSPPRSGRGQGEVSTSASQPGTRNAERGTPKSQLRLPSPPRSNPSPAGPGEGGRRPGEGRGETSKPGGRGQGEVSTSASQPGTRNPELGTLLLEKLPFFALTIAASVVTSLVQRGSGATVPLSAIPLGVRLTNMVMSYASYLKKTFWPDDLAVFYPYVITPWDAPQLWISLALLGVISWWLVRRVREFPAGLVGWGWFLGTFVPVIGLVQVGRQGMADRYTYIPHIGLFIAIVWGVAEILARWKLPRPAQTGLALAALAGCAGLTSRQVAFWEDTASLASHTVSVTQNNYIAHTQYATTLLAAGKPDAALAECDTALRIMPDYAEAWNTRGAVFSRLGNLAAARTNYQSAAQFDLTFPDPRHALADLALREGKFGEAETESRAALQLAPMHLGARYTLAQALHGQGKLDAAITAYQELNQLRPGVFHVHRGLASLYVMKGNLPAATSELRHALSIVPNNPETMNALGTVLLDQGDILTASNQFSAVLNLQPTNGLANFKIGQLLTVAKRERESIPHYRAALAAWPDSVEALNNLAWLLAASADATIRDGAEAVRLATRACELTGHREPLMLGTLAAAQAEAGQFPDAVSTAEKAITLARAANQPAVAQRNQELLELYRAGKPYLEPP